MFIFAAGYFYKKEYESNLWQFFKKKFFRLVMPMYVWNVLYGILANFLNSYFNFSIGEKISIRNILISPIIHGHKFVYNMASWFVIPLFCVEIIHIILRRLCYKNPFSDWILGGGYCFVGILGMIMNANGINTGWCLLFTRIAYFLPFYGIGFLYHYYLEKHDAVPTDIFLSVLCILQVCIMTIHRGGFNYTPSWGGFNGDIFMPFVEGILGTAFWLRLSRLTQGMYRNSNMIRMIADNTYGIMIHQFFGFMIVKTVFFLLKNLTVLCQDFSIEEYKTNIWWYYFPHGINVWGIIYLGIGLTFPLVMVKIEKRIVSFFN